MVRRLELVVHHRHRGHPRRTRREHLGVRAVRQGDAGARRARSAQAPPRARRSPAPLRSRPAGLSPPIDVDVGQRRRCELDGLGVVARREQHLVALAPQAARRPARSRARAASWRGRPRSASAPLARQSRTGAPVRSDSASASVARVDARYDPPAAARPRSPAAARTKRAISARWPLSWRRLATSRLPPRKSSSRRKSSSTAATPPPKTSMRSLGSCGSPPPE